MHACLSTCISYGVGLNCSMAKAQLMLVVETGAAAPPFSVEYNTVIMLGLCNGRIVLAFFFVDSLLMSIVE